MRKLLGTIVVIILLVIIFLLASPVFYGKQAQFFINKAVSNANQNYGRYGVVASISSYERNWYSSHAVIDISITNAQVKQWYRQHVNPSFDLQKPLVYQEVLTISHGPVMYHAIMTHPFSAADMNGYVVLPADLQQRLQLTAAILSFDGAISYTGVFKGNVVMPAFTYDSPSLQIKFKGLSFFGSVSSDLAHFKGHYTVQPLFVDLKEMKDTQYPSRVKIVLSLTQGHFDFKRTQMGLWTGYFYNAVQHEKFDFTVWEHQVARHFTVVYNNVVTNMNLVLKGEGYSIENHVTMGSYQLFSKLIIKNINIDCELDSLNAPVAYQLQELLLQTLSSRGGASVQLDLNQLRTLLPNLITPKTMLKLNNFSFDLPKGSVMANAQFSWPDYQAGMPLMTMGLITQVAFNVSAGKELVDNAIAQINKPDQAQAILKKATKEQPEAKLMGPALEPGPVILPKATQGSAQATTLVKKEPALKAAPTGVQSTMSPYVGELNQADELLKLWLAQGYIIEKNNTYQIAVTYKTNRLWVNGKEIKL